jgi:hypothetical protein
VSISSFEGSEGTVFWSADSQSAKALSDFVKKNPKYHVVTEVDSDEGEDEEGNRIFIHVNDMAIVNRLRYFLASGDKDDGLICVETDSFD